MKRFTALLVCVVLLAGVSVTQAQIIVPQPGVFTDPNWLKVDYHRVTVDIEDQIATTHVDMQFTNQGEALAEGTFIFPLPLGATVDQLTMWVDGQPIDAKVLPADEARAIYDQIVRQYRDPALLEYIGNDVIQANVFPIPPGDKRRIEIRYAQVLEVDNGLIHFTYPMNAAGDRPIEDFSIAVNVNSNDPISNIYSPSHNIAISRQGDKAFRAGFEARYLVPEGDFSLFYGLARDTINVNLLTYRESANGDGFFMLLVQPPLTDEAAVVVPKDVIVVLDQSGSMDGEKWNQARDAATLVLENLNSQDRFNVVLFSTGWRIFSNRMEDPAQARGAIDWIKNQEAIGGTDINAALLTALDQVGERPATILFMTDGLATEGVVETPSILENLKRAAPPNARIFTFGVGDDVDTFLLDAIVRDFRGTGTYVRPGERIDEKVASLYNKISAPVLTDVELDFGSAVITEFTYPTQLPDLFAGEQLTLVGRFRGAADDVTIRLAGTVNGTATTFTYPGHDFRSLAGGEPFIARLWATRRIGDLLNTIRLNGESRELVDSVVSLSVRYGIITPYTSFLIEEDDIFSQPGALMLEEAAEALAAPAMVSGEAAVDRAAVEGDMAAAEAPLPMATMVVSEAGSITQARPVVQTVGNRTFFLRGGVWVDSAFDPAAGEPQTVAFASDAYFDLLADRPELGQALALGEEIILVIDGQAYRITGAGGESSATEPNLSTPASGGSMAQTDPTPSPAATNPAGAGAAGQLCASALILPLAVLAGAGLSRRRRSRNR
jgi:Ca-activated chloride channel homolog